VVNHIYGREWREHWGKKDVSFDVLTVDMHRRLKAVGWRTISRTNSQRTSSALTVQQYTIPHFSYVFWRRKKHLRYTATHHHRVILRSNGNAIWTQYMFLLPPPSHFSGRHYYRKDIWSFAFVSTGIGPGTNMDISPGSNGYGTKGLLVLVGATNPD